MQLLGAMIYQQTELGIYVERGDWYEAGSLLASRHRSLYLRKSPDWDAATYYLRKAGIKGRLKLIKVSLKRRFPLLHNFI